VVGLIFVATLMIMLTINLVSDGYVYNFGKQREGIDNIWRRRANHKWFLFTYGMYRRFAFVCLTYFLKHPTLAVPQLVAAIIMTPGNVLVGMRLVPLP